MEVRVEIRFWRLPVSVKIEVRQARRSSRKAGKVGTGERLLSPGRVPARKAEVRERAAAGQRAQHGAGQLPAAVQDQAHQWLAGQHRENPRVCDFKEIAQINVRQRGVAQSSQADVRHQSATLWQFEDWGLRIGV